MPILDFVLAQEYSTSRMRGAVAYAGLIALLLPACALAATFSVNSTSDRVDLEPGDNLCFTGVFIEIGVDNGGVFGPECTLRAAIMEANASSGMDTVAFASTLPMTAGVVEIRPETVLPRITAPVLIDGYSASGYDLGDPNAVPIINLSGTLVQGTASGLTFWNGSNGSTVRGLAIHSFSSVGIVIEPGPSGTQIEDIHIEGNHIGIWRGIFYRGNGLYGIYLYGTRGVKIGLRCDERRPRAPLCPGRRNVIVDNEGDGIYAQNSNGVIIEGNIIGTNPSGTALFVPFGGSTPNAGYGIFLRDNIGSRIGSATDPEGGNLISGNMGGGIRIRDGGTNYIYGNKIGTNANGTAALGNEGHGIYLDSSNLNVVGGSSAAAPNLISGNTQNGILSRNSANIFGNTIGLIADQSAVLGNGSAGVALSGYSNYLDGNTIGGNGFDALENGITITGNSNTVISNLIGTNSLGEDLHNRRHGILVTGDGNIIGSPGEGNTIGFQSSGIRLVAHDNYVRANWIGTDAAGRNLRNFIGIEILGTGNEIGLSNGVTTGDANTIGLNFVGVSASTNSQYNSIRGNFIGTNALGEDLGNQGVGILARGDSTTIGGFLYETPSEVALAANVIAYNGNEGVLIGSLTVGVTIRGNEFYGHTETQAIDLGLAGPTLNDFGDTDDGGNRLQNFPEFNLAATSFNEETGNLEIRYRVDSNVGDAAYPIVVDFYLRSTQDGEADAYLGSDTYPLPSASLYRSVGIDPLVEESPPIGYLVATATDAEGNTSELSTQLVPVPEPGQSQLLLSGVVMLFWIGRRSLSRPGLSPEHALRVG